MCEGGPTAVLFSLVIQVVILSSPGRAVIEGYDHARGYCNLWRRYNSPLDHGSCLPDRSRGTLCTFFTFAPSSNSQLEPSDLSSRPARLRRTASAAAVGTSDATEWLASVARGAVDARLTSSMSINTVWISVFLLDEARGCSHSLLAQRLEQPERPWVHAIFFSTLTPLNSELRRPA